jgi:hypothetical protein
MKEKDISRICDEYLNEKYDGVKNPYFSDRIAEDRETIFAIGHSLMKLERKQITDHRKIYRQILKDNEMRLNEMFKIKLTITPPTL